MADSDIALFLSGTTPGASLGNNFNKNYPLSNVVLTGGGSSIPINTNIPVGTANVYTGNIGQIGMELSIDGGVTFGSQVTSANAGDVNAAYAPDGTSWIQGWGNNGISSRGPVTIAAAGANTLFDNIAAGQNSPTPSPEYRAIYVYNVSLIAKPMSIYVSQPPSGSEIAIGKEPAFGNIPAAIASESIAPSGITFNAATSVGSPLSLGTLASKAYIGVWIRRTPPGTGAETLGDSFSISVIG